jgi:hypothetical protein
MLYTLRLLGTRSRLYLYSHTYAHPPTLTYPSSLQASVSQYIHETRDGILALHFSILISPFYEMLFTNRLEFSYLNRLGVPLTTEVAAAAQEVTIMDMLIRRGADWKDKVRKDLYTCPLTYDISHFSPWTPKVR